MSAPIGQLTPFPRERFEAFCKRVRIQTKDFGLVPMELLGTQTYILDEICKARAAGIAKIMILKARQLGSTTFFVVLDLFWAMEYKGISGSFATHTEMSKQLFRNVIGVLFANLPKGFKIPQRAENRDMLILKNGSIIQYLVAGIKDKAKGGLGRSGANNFVHATEVSFWGSPDDLLELGATMSTHHPHRLYVEETTANGFNFWSEKWEAAKNDASIHCIFVGWWRHDHYTFADDDPRFLQFMPEGHDTRLDVLERKRKKLVLERYGIEVTHNQIAWYRWKMAGDQGDDQAKMDENFPWVEEDAFVATGANFFTNETLTDAMRRARQQAYMPFKYLMSDKWHETQCLQTRDRRGELKVWEEADPAGHYVIGCDPAYGSSENADRTVIHVARCFSDRLVQVAEFVSSSFSTYQCAWVLCHLAGYYKRVQVNLEINGPGGAVFNEMNRLKTDNSIIQPGSNADLRNVLMYMQHFLYRREDAVAGGGLAYQWRTSPSNKPPMMAGLKDSFELRRFILNSMPLLEEMKHIIIDGGIIEGEGKKKDDRVIAAALAHEAWRRWLQPKMRGMGISFAALAEEALHGKPSQVQAIALNYLHQQGIITEAKP
ncbi:MAG TPA: hypothetical protein VKD24_03515 [Candidatus Angelobacter sp.]|nr:hypothetical protein [Candidatus Angelobacter sp.]